MALAMLLVVFAIGVPALSPVLAASKIDTKADEIADALYAAQLRTQISGGCAVINAAEDVVQISDCQGDDTRTIFTAPYTADGPPLRFENTRVTPSTIRLLSAQHIRYIVTEKSGQICVRKRLTRGCQ